MRTRLASLAEICQVLTASSGATMAEPTLTGDPGNEIAILATRKLESPMILPTCPWKTTGKVCERRGDGGIASPAEEKSIDKTGRVAVLQSTVEGSKKAFTVT